MIDYSAELHPGGRMEMNRGAAVKISLFLPQTIRAVEVGKDDIITVYVYRADNGRIDYEVEYSTSHVDRTMVASYSFSGPYLIEWGRQGFE